MLAVRREAAVSAQVNTFMLREVSEQ